MQDSTHRSRTGYVVGKDEKTISSWDNAEAVTFPKTTHIKKGYQVLLIKHCVLTCQIYDSGLLQLDAEPIDGLDKSHQALLSRTAK